MLADSRQLLADRHRDHPAAADGYSQDHAAGVARFVDHTTELYTYVHIFAGRLLRDSPIMDFSWDSRKAATNAQKHGLTFQEAVTVFGDPLALTAFDPDHSEVEDRFITMGRSAAGRLLVVVHADEGLTIRIISSRKATRREREDYEDGRFP